jgi:Flp pilus assembly protein TadD
MRKIELKGESMHRDPVPFANGPKRSCRSSYLVLIVALFALTGCAVGSGVQHRSDVEQVREKTLITPLEDGRSGFVIQEPQGLDAGTQRDFTLAIGLLQERGYEPAIELLLKVVEQAPEHAAPCINLGMAYRQLGELEQAETYLRKALELVPAHPVASNEYGLLLRQQGRFAEARAIFEQTLARFPAYLPAQRNFAILCDLYLGDLSCALDHYEFYHNNRPEDEQVSMWIADLRLRLGQ